MLKLQKQLLIILSFLFCFSVSAHADAFSPVGYWAIAIAQHGNAIIHITEKNGSLIGTVYKTSGDQNAVCEKCKGDFHLKPVKGLTILWGFTTKDNRSWTGGKLLAVRLGETFDADLTPQDGGQELRITVHSTFGEHEEVWPRVAIQ